ncbi:N-acetyltransferase family protein [Vibrio cholerae]|uniref:GNAT family N-acetyltransferase n=1 Tax=Vibrio TaxID=662 RepID=UPI000893FBC2|nr:GNAT family N-acetyltransferase [Vibrio paracholerae]EKF9488586.1 GNAT family N-acetyltransferase [Vibrio cholerae]OFJ24268.1 GNAT family N-acetyltransferase [Vibrio paracholerae]WOQ99421.1 GNAT family N-acetyltransferase [Vibrio paracholerae]
MVIRAATKKDLNVLLGLIEQKVEFDRRMKSFRGEVTTFVEKIERRLFSEHPYAHVLLLEVNGKALGFALFRYKRLSFGNEISIWLDDLFVVEKHRSKGYGRKLMLALKTQAKLSSASYISWTVSAKNTKAQEFYKSLGAEFKQAEGQRPQFRW